MMCRYTLPLLRSCIWTGTNFCGLRVWLEALPSLAALRYREFCAAPVVTYRSSVANGVMTSLASVTVFGLSFGASDMSPTVFLEVSRACSSTSWTTVTAITCLAESLGGGTRRTVVVVRAAVGTGDGLIFTYDGTAFLSSTISTVFRLVRHCACKVAYVRDVMCSTRTVNVNTPEFASLGWCNVNIIRNQFWPDQSFCDSSNRGYTVSIDSLGQWNLFGLPKFSWIWSWICARDWKQRCLNFKSRRN